MQSRLTSDSLARLSDSPVMINGWRQQTGLVVDDFATTPVRRSTDFLDRDRLVCHLCPAGPCGNVQALESHVDKPCIIRGGMSDACAFVRKSRQRQIRGLERFLQLPACSLRCSGLEIFCTSKQLCSIMPRPAAQRLSFASRQRGLLTSSAMSRISSSLHTFAKVSRLIKTWSGSSISNMHLLWDMFS